MGGGSYSVHNATLRSKTYATASTKEIFKQRKVNNAMSPYDIEIRESRDSDEHPESLAIVLALDVTGSMGSIPHYLIKTGLLDVMSSIIKNKIEHPQLLFMGIGDHECDQAPLQVGQFESSDELLEHWLTTLWLEGGGGGNDGESYLLAWYFAAKHTVIDCWEKRKQKGILITIGDEPCLSEVPKSAMKEIMGRGQHDNFSSLQLLDLARTRYNVYHLHMKQGSNGMRTEVIDGWKQLMGNNLIIVERREDVARIVADIISANYVTRKATKTNSTAKAQDIIL